jgi:hypothetical protein
LPSTLAPLAPQPLTEGPGEIAEQAEEQGALDGEDEAEQGELQADVAVGGDDELRPEGD